MSKVEKFRDGIFQLRTRRFGDVAELMVEKMYDLKPSNVATCNRTTSNGDRVEIAFGTVLKKNDSKITEKNIVEQCVKANISHRAINVEDVKDAKFTVNIQQLKPANFDILYYGLFFKDKVRIYKANSNDIYKMPQYRAKQHRDNAYEAQFFITENNIKQHNDKFLEAELSYDELYSLLK